MVEKNPKLQVNAHTCPMCRTAFKYTSAHAYYKLTEQNTKIRFCSYTCYRAHLNLIDLKDYARKLKRVEEFFKTNSDVPETIRNYLTDIYIFADKHNINTEYLCSISAASFKQSETQLKKDIQIIKKIVEKAIKQCMCSESSLNKLTKIAIKQSIPKQNI